MKLFAKQFSDSHPVPNPSKPTKPGSSVNDFSFSDEEATLASLWESVRISSESRDIENFMNAFINFDHDVTIIDGHPTDVVHRIALYFLEFIVVETEYGSFPAEQYLLLYQKEKSMQLVTNVGLNVSFLQEDTERGTCNMVLRDQSFLVAIHALSKLCSWNHNKDLVIKLFSAQFFVISSFILESLISHLEDMVMVLSDGAITTPVTRYLVSVFSVVLGFTQLVGKVGKPDQAFILQVAHISKYFPADVKMLMSLGIDCLMSSEIPSLPNKDYSFSSLKRVDSTFKDKKPRKRMVDKSLDDFLDKVVPVLQKLLRKLSFLSNSLETDLHLADGVKSNLLLFCLTCQIEAISSTAALLLFRPSLVGDFLSNDSMRFIRPYMTPKSPTFLNPSIAYEVYFLRALGVIRLCGMGQSSLDATFNFSRWIEECVETLQSLEPLIHFVMDNALIESAAISHSEILEKGNELKICCSCPTRLNVKLPASGVFPWDEDTSSSVQFISFMSGDELESDVALTESIAQYWRARSNSLPTNQSYLFDPSKSFLGTRIEKSRHQSVNSNPMELVDKLVSSKSLQVLFEVILLSQSSSSYASFCEATLEPVLNCVNLYKASTIPGIALVQSLFRFLLRSMEQNPEATIAASRTVELWRKILDVLLPGGRPEYDKSEIASKLNRYLAISEDESKSFVYIQDKKSLGFDSETSVFASQSDEESEEATTFKLQLLTVDCALELLWLFTSQKLIFAMEKGNALFQDHLEERYLVDYLRTNPSNFSVMLISRWLCNYAILYSRMGLMSPFWLDVVVRVNATLRILVDQGQRALVQPDNDIFLWPSTYSCLRLLGKILFDSISPNWLDAFLYLDGIPTTESSLVKESYNQVSKRKITAHIVFFRTTQFLDCRNFSVGLIMRLLYSAAREFTLRIGATGGQDYEYQHLCEALFDDIVKYTLNMIRNHHSEPFPESHLASIKVLFEGIKVLIKHPESFSLLSEHKLSMPDIQQLFVRYGPARSWHKNHFAWTKSRPLVIKDWLLCLESMLLTSSNKNSTACFELILCSVPFVTALIDSNEKLQEMFCSSAQSKKKLTSAESGESHRHELCILIFSSLAGREEDSIVFFSPLFEMLVGNLPVQVQKLLLTIDKRIDSGKTVNVLEGDNKLSIAHEFVLQILIPLLPCWSEEWQVFTLETCIHLLQGAWTSVSNLLKVTSMKPSLIELILEVFHYLTWRAKKVAIKLLKHLGKFSVSVAELKKLIRSLKDKDEDSSESSADFLADILSTSMSASVDPQFYFYFEGKQSGIRLPVFQKWPGVNGFSFSTWFAVDWASAESNEMTLFHMRQSDGVGFELFLRRDNALYSNSIEVAYAVYHGKGFEPVEETIAKFQLNNVLEKWHYLGFAHCRGRKFLKKSHIQVVLDQDSPPPMDITFPKMSNINTFSCIGAASRMDSSKISFHGQMSSVYFFSQALPLKALEQLQMLKYRRFHEVASIAEGNRDLGLDSTISESLILAYNPGVEINGILLNNVPENVTAQFGAPVESEVELEAMGIKGHMNGVLLPGTYVSTSSDIRNALDSLGGIKVILPMFERLEFSGNSKSQHALLCQMLRLITNALNKTMETRRFMIQSGFTCLRFLLEKCDPSVLQASVIDELQLLQEKFESDDQWNLAIFLTLYVDFSLWVRTQFSTQDRILLEVEKFCRQRPQIIVLQNGLVKRLMQSVYITFSPDVPARIKDMGKSEQFQNFQKNSIMGTLMDSEIQILRNRILSSVFAILSAQGGINEDNVSSIINYIVFESNPHHKIEGILLLCKLINPDKVKSIPNILNVFTSTKILVTISHSCGLPRAKVRLHVWMLLCSILHFGLLTDSSTSKSQQLSESIKRQNASDPDTNEYLVTSNDQVLKAQMFGLDAHALSAVLMNAVKKTLEAMSQCLIDTELRDYEFSMMFHLLLTTMFGFNTKYVLASLEKIPMSHHDALHSHEDEDITSPQFVPESPPSMSAALKEFKISIPMILPALLEMLSFKLCSKEIRLKHFYELVDCFESWENVDIIFGIPHWQSLFFDFYLSVYNESENSSLNPDFSQPHSSNESFVEAISQTIAKMHLFAIQFGEPKTLLYKVMPRAPANLKSYFDITTLDLFEIMRRDQRALGCGMVKKTVGYLRVYVTKGLLMYDGFAFSVIRSILESLGQTISSLKKANMEKVEKEMRFKIIEMNVWFILETTCQYLIMPPMHPIVLPAKSENKTNSPQAMSLKIKGSPPELRRATSDQMGHFVDNLGMHDSDSSPFANAELTRIRSASSHEIGSTLNRSHGSSEKLKAFYTHADQDDMLPKISEISCEDTPMFRPADLHIDEINIDYAHYPNLTETAYDENFWMIIESLLSMLGVNESFQGSWVSRDRLLRLEAAIKVGINRGRFVVNLVQDSVEALLSSDGENQFLDSKPDRESKNLKANQKLFLDRVIDSSLWFFMRAILNLAVEGVNESFGATEDSIPVKAILKISILLNWAKAATKSNFDSESLFILARFSKLFDDSKIMTDNLWSKFAMKLLIEIIASQKALLIAKLDNSAVSPVANSSTTGTSVGLKSSKSYSELSALSKMSSPKTPQTSDNVHDHFFPDSTEDANRIRANSAQSDMSTMISSDYLLSKVNQYFEKARGVRVTWRQWMTMMNEVIKEAHAKEKAAVATRLDDMGFHKQTEEITNLWDTFNRHTLLERERIESKADGLVHKICSLELRLLKEYVRNDAQFLKKCESNWLSLRDELCNERGPWGSGNWDDNEVAWTIDPSEESMRMRKKLVRSGVPKSYIADFLTRNNRNSDEESNSDLTVSTRERQQSSTLDTLMYTASQDGEDMSGDKNQLSKLGFDLSILRDLHQYRAETDSQSGREGEDVDGDDVEDENDLAAEESLSVSEATTPTVSTVGASEPPVDTVLSDEVGREGDILFSTVVEIITPSTNSMSMPSTGLLQITRNKVIFTRASDLTLNLRSSIASVQSIRQRREESLACESLWACQQYPSSSWDISEISNVLLRYYQLRFVAAELFFTSRRVVFLNLMDPKAALKFHNTLRALKPPNMAPFLGRRPSTIIMKTLSPNSLQPLSEAWANREISNFEYLMRLNTIAGRTYNDLGQYPIFPWVLADYTSEVLDLKNPASFRDFRWPIGAQEKKQREALFSKYNDLVQNYDPDDEISLPPFHYGTHYSVAGFVVWYLMRCEPYTSLHIQLQDGRIDRADRLFDSIAAAWKGCTTNPSDAKELIPEMFYNPDILVNINEVDFGTTQGHRKIDHIALPAWAKDPHDFIFKHREALESEYVSRHLHHWIDLVFGYKQRPPHIPGGSEAAVDACNVFFHLTYENAVDLEKLKESNPDLYLQYVCQITEFGQTPSQLFFKEHIPRTPLHKVDIIWPIASIIRGVHTVYEKEDTKFGRPSKMLCYKSVKISYGPVVMIVDSDDKLLTVDHNRVLGIHSWQVNSQDAVPPFRLKVDALLADIGKGDSSNILTGFGLVKGGNGRERKIGVPFAPDRVKATKKIQHRSKDDSSLNRSTLDGGKEGTTKFRPVKIKTFEREERFLSRQSKQYVPSSSVPPDGSSEAAHLSVKSIMSPTPPVSNISLVSREQSRTERTVAPLDTTFPGGSFTNDVPLTSKAISSTTSTPTSEHRQQSKTRSQSMQSGSATKPRRYSNASSVSSVTIASGSVTPGSSSGVNAGLGSSTPGGQLPQPNSTSVTMMNMNIFSSTINAKVQDEHVSGRVFAYLQEANLLFSCGHWDWSVRVTSADNGKLLQILSQHQHHDVVTCLAVGKDVGSRWLVTGSRDCTVVVWEIILDRTQLVSVHPIRTLYGHDETVTCVAIHPEMDIIVSGSEDGTWITHNLRDGKYIRTVGNYELYPKWWNKVTNRHQELPPSKDKSAHVATSSTTTTSAVGGKSVQGTSVTGSFSSSSIPAADASTSTLGIALVAPIAPQRTSSDQTVPSSGGLHPSPSESNMTDLGSQPSTKEESTGDGSTLQSGSTAPHGSSDNTLLLASFQSIKAPIPTTPKRTIPLTFALEQQLSPGDDGMSSVVHGNSSFFTFDRPSTTTPSLHPDSLLSGTSHSSAAGMAASASAGVVGNNNQANAAVGGGGGNAAAAAAAAAALGRSQFWSVTWVGISKEGYIITYSAEHQRLATFTISGTFIASKKVPEALYAFALSDDGTVLVTGGSACLISFRWVHSLELASDGPRQGLEAILDGSTADYQIDVFPSPIRSIHLSRQERHLLVGLETGELRILAHDPDYLRERLHRKLQELGIL